MAPYLQDLGVTAVELMPVHAFNESEAQSRVDPTTGKVPRRTSTVERGVKPSAPPPFLTLPRAPQALSQFWGYSTASFFAPMPRYAARADQADIEFRAMVKVRPARRTCTR